MSTRTAARLAWALCGLCVLLVASAVTLSVINRSTDVPTTFGTRGGSIAASIALLSFPVVGALIASRQPRNSMAWISLAAGMASSIGELSEEYAAYGLLTASGTVPGALVMAWLGSWIWVAYVGLIGIFFVLLFPDGHPLSRRWGLVGWMAGAGLVAAVVALALSPGPLEAAPYETNPYALSEAPAVVEATILFGLALVPVSFIAASCSMVVRFRLASGELRQQLKWLTSAAVLLAATFAVLALLNVEAVSSDAGPRVDAPLALRLAQDAGDLAFAGIAVAAGIAILKYRLYNIDRIINRTLVYGVLTALLGLFYAGIVVVLQGILAPVTEDQSYAVVGSTLAVAALFRPARARIQRFIDRRFYRNKYDATRTLEAFSVRLRDEVDLDTLSADLLAVVRETMQPAHSSLWLRASQSSLEVARPGP